VRNNNNKGAFNSDVKYFEGEEATALPLYD
jgi:hypothetical protein